MFVKYNRQLKDQFDRRDIIDPISLKHIDESNEWLVGVMEDEGEVPVFYDDPTFTWGIVAQASGANDPARTLRSRLS